MNCKCNAAKGRKANILCECSVECEKGQRVCNGCQSDDHKFTTSKGLTRSQLRVRIIDKIDFLNNTKLEDLWNRLFDTKIEFDEDSGTFLGLE